MALDKKVVKIKMPLNYNDVDSSNPQKMPRL